MSYFWEVEDNVLSLGKKRLLTFECEIQGWVSLALHKQKGPKPQTFLRIFLVCFFLYLYLVAN